MEQLLSLFLLLLVSIQLGLVLWPSSMNGSYYLAVVGSEIWNTNLIRATWIGLYGAAYLTAATVSSINSNGKEEDGAHSMNNTALAIAIRQQQHGKDGDTGMTTR